VVRSHTPPPDRAALSARTRDHVHATKTTISRWDIASFVVDLFVAFGGVLLVTTFSLLAAFGILRHGSISPQVLSGPPMYEMAGWLFFSGTAAVGLWGLFQFWQKRIWAQTYGTQAQLWTGIHGIQLLLGALMPVFCLAFLNGGGLLVSAHGLFFAVVALIYLRHGIQVIGWSFG
jgi:hypothetical protein